MLLSSLEMRLLGSHPGSMTCLFQQDLSTVMIEGCREVCPWAALRGTNLNKELNAPHIPMENYCN
jgi:hypothetical protein